MPPPPWVVSRGVRLSSSDWTNSPHGARSQCHYAARSPARIWYRGSGGGGWVSWRVVVQGRGSASTYAGSLDSRRRFYLCWSRCTVALVMWIYNQVQPLVVVIDVIINDIHPYTRAICPPFSFAYCEEDRPTSAEPFSDAGDAFFSRILSNMNRVVEPSLYESKKSTYSIRRRRRRIFISPIAKTITIQT